jgi:2-polyprenyl-3-methyl-5-hydroxy-6-metoxy-1,4-benzoquinol methylase
MLTADQERQLMALRDDYPGHYMGKFCRCPSRWFRIAREIAEGMGLHQGPHQRILDIGCGFGYFTTACMELGHTVTGLDVPDDMIRDATTITGIEYRPHVIQAHQPLPDGLDGFDLVTTFGVNFRHGPDKYWANTDYYYLATDIHNRLRPDGRWVLRPNLTTDADSPIALLVSPGWWRRVVGPTAEITITDHEVQIQWTTD